MLLVRTLPTYLIFECSNLELASCQIETLIFSTNLQQLEISTEIQILKITSGCNDKKPR